MAILFRRTQLFESSELPMRALMVGFLSLVAVASSSAATLAGQQVQPRGKTEIRFPVSKYFQDIASQGGNPRPDLGRAVLTFPAGFDPSRTWPILIVTSTSDFNRTSAMDVEWYRSPATAEGWVVLGPDATIKPRIDSTQWRPDFSRPHRSHSPRMAAKLAVWPVAFAGFFRWLEAERHPWSDAGQERVAFRVCGFFLSGINEDRISEGYKSVPAWPAVFSRCQSG